MTYKRVKLIKISTHRKHPEFVNLTCAYKECGKQFIVSQGELDEGRKYCSMECSGKARGFKKYNI